MDYGVDGLAHGLSCLGELIDWPVKPQLHGEGGFPYYPEPFNLPKHGFTAVEQVFANCEAFDLIVIADASQATLSLINGWRMFLYAHRSRIVFYDGGDDRNSNEHHIATALGFAPKRHFKRELPLGATWALPLAFGFPEERIPADIDYSRKRGAFCATADTPDRATIGRVLGGIPGVNFQLSNRYDDRLSLSEFRDRYAQALVGLSPSGFLDLASAGTWMTYRHLEVAALGCCPFLDYPRIQWRNGYENGREAIYYQTPEQAWTLLKKILDEPDRAITIGQAARSRLRADHTTKSLAEYLVRSL